MRTATLLLTCPLFLGACGAERDGIAVGDAWIPGSAIDTAVQEMKGSFPQWGDDTLAWNILDGGFGPAWLLHDEFAAQSVAALAEAEHYAERLRQGEAIADLAAQKQLLADSSPIEGPFAPTPFELRSGRVAAAVAALEPGQWSGPLKTIRGWELVGLAERAEGPRNRAGVRIVRLEFTVGDDPSRLRAEEAWNTLPLTGSLERIRRLPYTFRRNRVPAPESS